jgi:hypothetical protein
VGDAIRIDVGNGDIDGRRALDALEDEAGDFVGDFGAVFDADLVSELQINAIVIEF